MSTPSLNPHAAFEDVCSMLKDTGSPDRAHTPVYLPRGCANRLGRCVKAGM